MGSTFTGKNKIEFDLKKGSISILSSFCFMWSSALDSYGVLLSYFHNTTSISYNHHTDIYSQTSIFIRFIYINI